MNDLKKKARVQPKPHLTTNQLADVFDVKSQSVRASYCRKGDYMGLRPVVKLPNGRLLWDAESAYAIVNGDGEQENAVLVPQDSWAQENLGMTSGSASNQAHQLQGEERRNVALGSSKESCDVPSLHLGDAPENLATSN